MGNYSRPNPKPLFFRLDSAGCAVNGHGHQERGVKHVLWTSQFRSVPPMADRHDRYRGMTQEALGAAAGVSNRVITYYEADDAQPPGRCSSISPRRSWSGWRAVRQAPRVEAPRTKSLAPKGEAPKTPRRIQALTTFSSLRCLSSTSLTSAEALYVSRSGSL
jgi:hypothetical protein